MMGARIGAVSTTWNCWKDNSCPIINTIVKVAVLKETPEFPITKTPKERNDLVRAHFLHQKEPDTYVEDPFIQVKCNNAKIDESFFKKIL